MVNLKENKKKKVLNFLASILKIRRISNLCDIVTTLL